MRCEAHGSAVHGRKNQGSSPSTRLARGGRAGNDGTLTGGRPPPVFLREGWGIEGGRLRPGQIGEGAASDQMPDQIASDHVRSP
jgi:hypothetical protein